MAPIHTSGRVAKWLLRAPGRSTASVLGAEIVKCQYLQEGDEGESLAWLKLRRNECLSLKQATSGGG
ncbi:hypothetical protein PI125_g24227 [Phytophthora idaei]|nr:hypothetical protein PI125_g24227 [Phytophthora idaei]